MKLGNLFKNILLLFFPPLCTGCSEVLTENEPFLCLKCFLDLPKTNYHLVDKNPAYDRFAGKFPVQKASAFLYYDKSGLGQKLMIEFKYRKNIYMGKWIGTLMAKEMLNSHFFEGIDFIVPVPLHKKKLKKRGFNQSEILCNAIASVTGISVETQNLYRREFNVSQTKKGIYERWQGTIGIFDIRDTALFEKKQILLIDDVLTTGATLDACAQALLKSADIKISILTLAIA
jgi:ComF family protein